MMKDLELFQYIYSLSPTQIAGKYEYLGEGVSRKVYAVNDDYVVKVAKGNDGLYQNRLENYVYTNADKHLLKYLCPIIYFKPHRLIMRKATPLSNYHKHKYINLKKIRPEDKSFSDLKKLTKDFFLDYEDINSTSSWGILENENILIDYGCTSYLGDTLYNMWFGW